MHGVQKPYQTGRILKSLMSRNKIINNIKMKKVMTIFGAIMITLFMLTSCGGPDPSSIATKTFKSGYYYLFFKNDHSIEIYQKSSSSSFARGCAADGKWSIENGKVKV